MSVVLNSGIFGNNGRGSIVLDKANGVREVITPVGDTKMVVAGGSIRGSLAGMTNSIIVPGPTAPIGTSFGSYGFIGGPSFPPPPPSLTLANSSITPRIGLPVTVPGVPIIRTSTLGATTVGTGFTSGVQNINTFVPSVGISSGVNMMNSGIGGGGIITTTTADQAMLASVQRSAFGERISTVAPAFNSNQLPPLQPTVIVDVDPITPGIQIETSTGPVTVMNTNSFGTGFNVPNAIVDADPITPGIQSSPGIITASGPSVVVGKIPSNQCSNGIFSWILPLLCLLLLAGLLSSIYYYVKSRQQTKQQVRKSYSYSYQCGKNGFLLNGRCITCPTGSQWDGKSCVYERNDSKSQTKTKVSKVQAIEQNTTGGTALPESMTISQDKKIGSKDKKVAIFDQQNLQRNTLSIPQQQGIKPQLVSTKPVPSKPSVVIDSKGGDTIQNQQFTSTNVVTVAPIISRKSVPVKYTYSTQGFKTQTKSKSIADQA